MAAISYMYFATDMNGGEIENTNKLVNVERGAMSTFITNISNIIGDKVWDGANHRATRNISDMLKPFQFGDTKWGFNRVYLGNLFIISYNPNGREAAARDTRFSQSVITKVLFHSHIMQKIELLPVLIGLKKYSREDPNKEELTRLGKDLDFRNHEYSGLVGNLIENIYAKPCQKSGHSGTFESIFRDLEDLFDRSIDGKRTDFICFMMYHPTRMEIFRDRFSLIELFKRKDMEKFSHYCKLLTLVTEDDVYSELDEPDWIKESVIRHQAIRFAGGITKFNDIEYGITYKHRTLDEQAQLESTYHDIMIKAAKYVECVGIDNMFR